MTVSIELQMEQMGQRAKKAARVLSAAAPAAKTQALRALAALLIERQPDILKANALDVDAAKAANMDAPRLDRLTLTPRIMADMADALSLIHIFAPGGNGQRRNDVRTGKHHAALLQVAQAAQRFQRFETKHDVGFAESELGAFPCLLYTSRCV